MSNYLFQGFYTLDSYDIIPGRDRMWGRGRGEIHSPTQCGFSNLYIPIFATRPFNTLQVNFRLLNTSHYHWPGSYQCRANVSRESTSINRWHKGTVHPFIV